MPQHPAEPTLRYDIKSSLVVFLVALPLCLGIAVASGAPPISGIIAGIVGGIIVGSLSGSHVSVSGPAAGLTVIVLDSIARLGSFELFLACVVVAGLLQVAFGLLKGGVIGYYFPNSVIKGMLAAIGLILILKQIPHALGWDKDAMGDMAFLQLDSANTFSEIWLAIQYFSPGAIPITLLSMLLIYVFERPAVKEHALFGLVPGALWAVVLGTLLNVSYGAFVPQWQLDGEHLVTLPVVTGPGDVSALLTLPDFSGIMSGEFWLIAVTVALIASVETLLSIEAGDKLDPKKRITPASRELLAQGVGNTVSGVIGGLPITAVIVRTSANISSGARTRLSAILHGVLLLVLFLAISRVLNFIPLSCLAAVLFSVGYKLARPEVFLGEFRKGPNQFAPFLVTVLAILFTDLLVGIAIGFVVGIFFVVRTNYRKSIQVTELRGRYLVKMQKDVSFLNKAPLLKALEVIPDGSEVILSATKSQFIDHDIREVLEDFIQSAPDKGISVELDGFNDQSEALS